jgi:FixJ family two-component response regulator
LIEALARMKPMNLQDARGANLLSKREETVARLVAEGLTNREISNELRLSEHTVHNYLLGDFRQTAGVVTRGIGALLLAGSACWNGRARQLTLKPGTPV